MKDLEQIGKLPPQNQEAEASVLGAVLLSANALPAVMAEGITAADFYRPRHQLIYAAILKMNEADEPIDTLTVVAELERRNEIDETGGTAYIHSLPNLVPSAGNIAQYARIVKEHATLRGIIDLARGMSDRTYEGSGVKDIIESAEVELFRLAREREQRGLRPISDVLSEEMDRLELASSVGGVTGLATGFKDVDELTGGFQPGNLIVVAARPAMGKSAFILNVAEHVALAERPVALFTLEMSAAECAQRFIASRAKMNGEALRRGYVRANQWPGIVQAVESLASAPLFIDDSSGVTLAEIRQKARRLAAKVPLGLIVIDYLQLMEGRAPGTSRHEVVADISRGLKALARELELPLIAVSQLSRAVEQRPDKRPQLSDLRESGQIEQDADMVAFLYRDDYYDKESHRPGEADVIVAKHRHGPTGDVALAFLPKYPAFRDLAKGFS